MWMPRRESEMDSLLAKTNERLSETRRTLADTERVGTLLWPYL